MPEIEEVLVDMAAEAEVALSRYTTEGLTIGPEAAGANPELLVDVWVFDPTLNHTLLVEHPVRGWIMPGGKVEPGELVRDAAQRELHEETGVVIERDLLRPAAVGTGYDGARPWFAMAFDITIPTTTPLVREHGRAVRWWPLDAPWQSVYPHDRDRLVRHAELMKRDPRPEP